MKKGLFILVFLLSAGTFGVLILQKNKTPDLQPAENAGPTDQIPPPERESTKTIHTNEILNIASVFDFSTEIPASWEVEAIPAIEAINIYDPALPGENNLERSEIFIRHFSGSQFLTLSTVTIHKQTNASVSGRPAVEYDIEKKSTIANFPSQPSWRNTRHITTDVRVSDTSPSVFYVFAARPKGNADAYARFLATLRVNAE